MAFKVTKKTTTSYENPESLFRDLRSRKVEGLMSQQADMLRAYIKNHDASDVALELPTGSGKTLVGLLIAEWRRVKYLERCVFLCPTIQLVNQVAEQAKEKYGIDVVCFTKSARDYTPSDKTRFLSGEVIAVSTYSALFNSNSFFSDVGTIIFDDAHAGENYVSKCWSVEIDGIKHEGIFKGIVDVIEEHISDQDKASFEDNHSRPVDCQWVNKLPLPKFLEIKSKIVSVLDASREISDIYYPWLMIRNSLEACNLYYTNNSILIRPTIPPTESFAPFKNAKQRIYMSATLGEGGDLERIFGTYRIKRIPAPDGWSNQGVGRRFFIFPMCLHSEDDSKNNSFNWIRLFSRALILTVSEWESLKCQDQIKKNINLKPYALFTASEIEKSKKTFTNSTGIAILANRFDGIDLSNDECRYLIVCGLPEAINLQERFLITRMGASLLFDVRIRTRITQAVGRCTRSATDWALVVVIGEKSHNYLLKPENRKRLHPELQAEIIFGLEQSNVSEISEVEDNIKLFCEQGDEWRVANQEIIRIRDGLPQVSDPILPHLSNCFEHEIKYANSLWLGDYESAYSSALDALNHLNGNELRGYRGWWYYLAGNAAYISSLHGQARMLPVAKSCYVKASAASTALVWLRRLDKSLPDLNIAKKDELNENLNVSGIIERLEHVFENITKANSKKIESKFISIRTGLSSTNSSEAFEQAQVLLGELLGYVSLKIDEESAPDPFWIMTEKMGIVFEDYTATTGDNPRVGKGKILQAKGHIDWLKVHHPDVSFKVILCSSTREITHDSLPFHTGVSYIHVDEMKSFADDSIKVIRKLWDSYSHAGNMDWREESINILIDAGFSPESVMQRLTKQNLNDLSKKA